MNEENAGRVSELKPCPFCNDPMELHFDVIRHVNQGDCVVGAYAWPDSRLNDWNTRAIEPLRPATEQAGGEVVAWMHPTARWVNTDIFKVLAHCQKGVPGPIPLYASPPSPAATQSAVVSEEMVERGAAELANIRGVKIMDEVDQRLFAADARAILCAALSNPGASQ